MRNSDVGKELMTIEANGDQIFHEIHVDALLEGISQQDKTNLRVNGVIDLLFYDINGKISGDAGKWCILDYKLIKDPTNPNNFKKYKKQLYLYKKVLEAWKPNEAGKVGLWIATAGKEVWLSDK